MTKKLLKYLSEDARLTEAQLAAMLGADPAAVHEEIRRLEREGILMGYRAVVDWDRVEGGLVESYIDLKLSPKKDFGYDEFGELVSKMPQVKSCTLLSGSEWDISLVVQGRDFKEIALFVAQTLAPMDSVMSTSTRFVLKTYKKQGFVLAEKDFDERERLF